MDFLNYEKLTQTQPALFLISVFCALVLITAWIMEHVFGIQACQLCYYERYVYMAAGVVALLGGVLNRKVCLGTLSLIFLFGFGLSFYHVGIQQGWFDLPSFCQTAIFDPNASIEDLRAQLLGTPMITCNVVSWDLFGISLAGYNALASLILSVLTFGLYRKNR